MQRPCGNVHKMIELLVELRFILAGESKPGHVERYDADAAGAFAAAEETAALLAKLTQVKAQTAAHGAYIARLHIAVDVVGEVGSAVLAGHLEQKTVVLGRRPIKILGNGIGGDGVLETAPVGVAVDHNFDERLVDHIHFLFAVTVGEIHLLAADDGRTVPEVVGNLPIKGDIGERSLSAPARGGVDAVNKALDALLDLIIGEVIGAHEGSKVGIK